MIAEFVKMEGSSTGDLVVSEPMKPKFGETKELRSESNGKLVQEKILIQLKSRKVYELKI